MGEFKPPEVDAAHRPIVDLLQKKDSASPLLFVVGKASDVLHAADALSGVENGVAGIRHEYLINANAQGDFNYAVEALGKEKALVLGVPMMHRMPQTIERYNLIGELFLAGAEVAIIPVSDAPSDLESVRARTADLVRSGVQRAEAIRALTINPAKAVGADKRLGSIEKGKDADLVFLDGDPLDPAARVKRVMILGKIVWEAAR
jgi:imidazolonepropionase-like amidohydrolase